MGAVCSDLLAAALLIQSSSFAGGQGAGKLGDVCTIAEAGANEIMVVPQASLAGKMKGKKMQYHNACNKDL